LVPIEQLVPDKKVAQLEPNFDGIVIGWSSSNIVSGSRALPPRWPPQCSCVVIESSFDPGERLQYNFGKGPFNDNFIKIWFQLSNWFQTRRFLCEFPIGSYVKLSSAVVAILVEGRTLSEIHIKTILSGTSSSIRTKL
jgi:hypothetical protein